MTSAWELISTERQGQAGRRAIVAKTFRMPDGSESVFTVMGDVSSRSVACVALTPRQTAVLAEQDRPGPERVMTELPGYFWSEALGWPLVWDQGLQTAIRSPRGGPKISWDGERMMPKTGKSRLRFDLAPPVNGDQQGEASRLVDLGATRIDTGQGEVSWVAMADPDGREFCVLTPR